MKEILLITPPFTQLNTPYPATAYLKGFLNTIGKDAYQVDLGIEVILKLFSSKEMTKVFAFAAANNTIHSANSKRIFALKGRYLLILDEVILFLQGKNQTIARQICTENFLPRASRFEQLDDLDWAFGNMGMQDKAKHLATLFLEDISDFLVECVDPHFGFSRYAERLGQSANSFDELYLELKDEPTYIDELTIAILSEQLENAPVKLVCFSVPFPGNLYSAFRCAKYIKQNYPTIKIAMGGGFPNTELREVNDVRVFEFVDFITLDDGELPIELVISNVFSPSEANPDFGKYKRTFCCLNGKVVYLNNTSRNDYKQQYIGTPNYANLKLGEYISVIEIANPMHSLWSDGRWNKLTMAHGCYWGKCTFCDISLDYIKIYEPIAAKLLVDRVEEMIAQTGETGFHFVDEAAPPALMKAFALEVLKRNVMITWWTNIRFEKNFTADLCELLKAAGCIAVSGGLEVASDRLLQLIDKGVSVEQVAQVTRNFTDAEIMVHAYLMYGYPTQTVQETVDSLEMVRQLFEIGIIQSGFWHQFALTAHSPIGLSPKDYGVNPNLKTITFANNDIDFKDVTGIDHTKFSFGLKKSLFNYMHGIGFDLPLSDWFDFKIPRTSIRNNYIDQCLQNDVYFIAKPTHKIIWLGSDPTVEFASKSKKGNTWEIINLNFHLATTVLSISLDKEKGEWFIKELEKLKPSAIKLITFTELKTSFEAKFDDFELFWHSKPINRLKENGLLAI